ncbi:hypothetical protein NC981_02400 [Leptolyngbya sp. DQ-M1]|uniref:hypothetical protein n=1 Tax=Leptolyngbya sp. DQ-M1 TaxID=2933920 RepID=UPI0032996C0B
MKRIVLIVGFELLNAGLYGQVADLAQARCSGLDVRVFSDRSRFNSKVEDVEVLSVEKRYLLSYV